MSTRGYVVEKIVKLAKNTVPVIINPMFVYTPVVIFVSFARGPGEDWIVDPGILRKMIRYISFSRHAVEA